MNICLFTSTFLPKTGGLENVVDTLAKTFIRLGHNVVVLAKTPRGMKEPPKFDYPVHYYKRSRSEVWFLGSPKRELLRLHKQYKFDIIPATSTRMWIFIPALSTVRSAFRRICLR